MLELARLRINDCLFSSIGLPSSTLSLRATSLILLRLSPSPTKIAGTDVGPGIRALDSGLGNSIAVLESTLLCRVLAEPVLLRVNFDARPRLLLPLRWPPVLLFDGGRGNVALSLSSDLILRSDLCFPGIACDVGLLCEASDRCLEPLLIPPEATVVPCPPCSLLGTLPSSGIFTSARMAPSPFPIEEPWLNCERRLACFGFPLTDCEGRDSINCGGSEMEGWAGNDGKPKRCRKCLQVHEDKDKWYVHFALISHDTCA